MAKLTPKNKTKYIKESMHPDKDISLLTQEQEKFIREYYNSDKSLSPECVMRAFVVLFLEGGSGSDKEHTAWLINRIKPQYYLPNMAELIDMQEIRNLAYQWQAKIDRAKKFAQKRRHEKREDFALTDDEWVQTVTHFGGCCAYCGSEARLTYDHFIPFSKGGSFTKNNVIPACRSCNGSKNNNDFNEWYVRQPFFNEERRCTILDYVGKVEGLEGV